MKTISADLQSWKAVEDQEDPLVTLVDVEIDDTTTVYLVSGHPDGTKQITFQSNNYVHANLDLGEPKENVESNLFSLELSISNLDGVAGGYIELNELEGRQVTIRHIPLSKLSGSPVAGDWIEEGYTIQNQSYTRQAATITLGTPNFLDRVIPFRQFIRHRCQWNYGTRFLEDSGCFYPSDYFEADTEQDMIPVVQGAATEVPFLHGWFGINMDEASFADVNLSSLSEFRLRYPDSTNVAAWLNAARDGPFAYKKISGDFDVFSKVDPLITGGSRTGFICQSVSTPSNWVSLFLVSTNTWVLRRTISDVSTDASDAATASDRWLRLVRSGDDFEGFYSDDGASWTSVGTWTVVMGADIRIGIAVFQDTSNPATPIGGDYEFFRFNAGGLIECDRTLDGEKGCNAHSNSTHFGAFPVIPRR